MIRFASIKFPFCSFLAAALLFCYLGAQEAKAGNTSGLEIYKAAKDSVGKEMWKGYGLPNGTLGCSAALSNVLKKAGVSGVKTPLVTAARRQILANPLGCTERTIRSGEGTQINNAVLLKDCQPGDILLAFKESPNKLNGGTSAHCGIMGEGTRVYTNNWMDGIWTEVEIHQMFDYYPQIRLLRLGQSAVKQSK